MQELFANNAESTIADVGGITSTATTITLASGEGARFPAAVTGTSQFRAALVDASTNAVLEYVTVTNRSTDILTVTRESEDATRFPKAARAQGVKVVDVITAAVLSLIGVPAGGTAGQVLGKSTSADYAQAWKYPPHGVVTFSYSGTLTTKTGTGRFRMPVAATIIGVSAAVNTAPTGASVKVDVNKNGTTVYTTQGNRPDIAVSTNAAAETTPDVTALAVGDYLTCDIDQIGSTVPGVDLVVNVRYRETLV